MGYDVRPNKPITVKVAAGSTNIPSSFDNTNTASMCLTGIVAASHIEVWNNTPSTVAINYTSGVASGSPGGQAPTGVDFYAPPCSGEPVRVYDTSISRSVFIRSDSGAVISTGTVYINVW